MGASLRTDRSITARLLGGSATMAAIVRRTAAILLLLFTAGGLLIACGKSARYRGEGQRGAKTQADVGKHAGGSLTRSRAKRLAPRLNLQASDLPGFTAASEKHHRQTTREKGLGRKLARCMGERGTSSALAEASSRSFERQAEIFHVSVSSTVTIAATPAQALAGLKAVRGEHTRVCLTGYMRELLAGETHGATSAKLLSISRASPARQGTEGTFAWRIAGEFMLRGVKVPFYIELVGFAHGQAEVELLSFGLPVPFPARAEQELFSLLIARAKAGAAGRAGKGVKPPEVPSLSGPRRVQISL
jgi:hypothetical protein